MAVTDFEGLSVVLNAKVDQFKKGMNEAVQSFDQGADAIERRNTQLTQRIEKSMADTAASTRFLTAAFKQLLTYTALEKLATGIIKANEELAKMATTAERLAISTDKLQEGSFAAKTLGGVAPTDFGAGLESLRLKAEKELREGEGELTRLFEANNLKLTDRNGKLKDANQFYLDAARLISQAGSALEKVEIARILTLPSDEWIKALEKGPTAIQNVQNAAKSSGAILDKELIEKAVEFDKAWNNSWSKFVTGAKAAAVEAGSAFETIAAISRLEHGTTLPGDVKALIRAAENAESTPFVSDPFGVAKKYRAGAILANQKGLAIGLPDQLNIPEEPRPVDVKIKTRSTVIPTKPGGGGADDFEKAYNSLLKQTEELRAQAGAEGLVGKALDEHVASEKILQAAQEAGITLTKNQVAEVHSLAKEFADLKEQIEGIKFNKDFIFQVQQLGRTKDEQSVFADVRSRFGGDTESDRAKNAIDKLTKLHELTEAKDFAGGFVKGLITDLENGVKAGQALENQLKRIADKLLDKTIDSALSGLFGGLGKSLFGGGFGAGDYARLAAGAAPGSYGPGFSGGGIVGRDGSPTFISAASLRGARHFQEGGGVPAIVHEGELILNRAQQKNVLASMGNGGPINLTHAPVLQGIGLSREELFSVMQRSQKEFARQIGPIFADWQRRHQT